MCRIGVRVTGLCLIYRGGSPMWPNCFFRSGKPDRLACSFFVYKLVSIGGISEFLEIASKV
jgi:hypothetical protein